MGGPSSVVDEDVDNPVEKQPMPGITLSFLWTACGQPENLENTGREPLCRTAREQ
jgi:hypothetical protein